MMETIILWVSMTLLAAIVYLELACLHRTHLPFNVFAKRSVGSQNWNLLLYELVVFTTTVGLSLLIDKSPFLSDAFPTLIHRALPAAVVGVCIFIWNRHRFGLLKFGFDIPDAKNRAFEEVVDGAESPEEGMANIIDFMKSRAEKFEDSDLESFLRYLSKRSDRTGELARLRLTSMKNSTIASK